jgi:hypothetical protein
MGWSHPLARAYYDGEPGEEFELDQRGYANLSGVVDSLATLTTHALRVRRLELRSADGKFTLISGADGFEPHDEAPRGTMQADGLPDVLALLTSEQYRLITESRTKRFVDHTAAPSGSTHLRGKAGTWQPLSADVCAADCAPAQCRSIAINRGRVCAANSLCDPSNTRSGTRTSTPPAGDAIESRIDTAFTGWTGETLFFCKMARYGSKLARVPLSQRVYLAVQISRSAQPYEIVSIRLIRPSP